MKTETKHGGMYYTLIVDDYPIGVLFENLFEAKKAKQHLEGLNREYHITIQRLYDDS